MVQVVDLLAITVYSYTNQCHSRFMKIFVHLMRNTWVVHFVSHPPCLLPTARDLLPSHLRDMRSLPDLHNRMQSHLNDLLVCMRMKTVVRMSPKWAGIGEAHQVSIIESGRGNVVEDIAVNPQVPPRSNSTVHRVLPLRIVGTVLDLRLGPAILLA